MKHVTHALWLVAMAIVVVLAPTGVAEEKRSIDNAAKSRTFRFDYGATLAGLPEGANVRVWLPVPQTDAHQTIKRLAKQLPAEASVAREPVFGNQILYFEVLGPASGKLSFTTSYEVSRREVVGLAAGGGRTELSDAERKQFLSASTRVPLQGKQLRLLEGVELANDPLAKAHVLYDRVDEHVRYDKSKPGYGNGDVLWVCDSRFGNCTDFHSLFISLARANGLPARFEIGFPLPPQRGAGVIGGYHCWAWFYGDRHGWVPVDISEADKHPELKEYYFGNLTEHRMTFSTGRDIRLVPEQAGARLNYFVYPYVEVDGVPLAGENLATEFRYRDL